MDKEYMDELNQYVKTLMDDLESEDMSTKLKKLTYSELLDEYLIKHGKDKMLDDYSDVVPVMFQISDDYDKKNKILEDAINNGILIENSTLFPDILEHVEIEKETIPSR